VVTGLCLGQCHGQTHIESRGKLNGVAGEGGGGPRSGMEYRMNL